MNQALPIRNNNDICIEIDQAIQNTPCDQMANMSCIDDSLGNHNLCKLSEINTLHGKFQDINTQEIYECDSVGFIGGRPNDR